MHAISDSYLASHNVDLNQRKLEFALVEAADRLIIIFNKKANYLPGYRDGRFPAMLRLKEQ